MNLSYLKELDIFIYRKRFFELFSYEKRICQSLSKFGRFTCVCLFHSIFPVKGWIQKGGGQFSRGGTSIGGSYKYIIAFLTLDYILTLSTPIPDKEKKSSIFIFTLLCGGSKGFMKPFIKPFEAPQRSVKIKIFNTTFRNTRGGKG